MEIVLEYGRKKSESVKEQWVLKLVALNSLKIM